MSILYLRSAIARQKRKEREIRERGKAKNTGYIINLVTDSQENTASGQVSSEHLQRARVG